MQHSIFDFSILPVSIRIDPENYKRHSSTCIDYIQESNELACFSIRLVLIFVYLDNNLEI